MYGGSSFPLIQLIAVWSACMPHAPFYKWGNQTTPSPGLSWRVVYERQCSKLHICCRLLMICTMHLLIRPLVIKILQNEHGRCQLWPTGCPLTSWYFSSCYPVACAGSSCLSFLAYSFSPLSIGLVSRTCWNCLIIVMKLSLLFRKPEQHMAPDCFRHTEAMCEQSALPPRWDWGAGFFSARAWETKTPCY